MQKELEGSSIVLNDIGHTLNHENLTPPFVPDLKTEVSADENSWSSLSPFKFEPSEVSLISDLMSDCCEHSQIADSSETPCLTRPPTSSPVIPPQDPTMSLIAVTADTPSCSGTQCHTAKTSTERTYACSLCTRRFRRRSALVAHTRFHAAHGKPFSCVVCQKTFAQQKHLAEHERRHARRRPYSCSVCKKTFLRPYERTRHMRRHTRRN